jgi:hypothetical protein
MSSFIYMIELKSIPFYRDLLVNLYRDIAERYFVASRTQSIEIAMLSRRLDAEGFSFLTKTLPSFGKSIDIALSTGCVLSTPAFEKRRGSKVPKFLGWLIERIFAYDGTELPNGDPVALKHLRQFVFLLYKLKIPYESSLQKRVLDSFVQTDMSLSDFDNACQVDPIVSKAAEIISSVLGTVDPHDVLPRHGPGAVATGETTVEKGNFSRIYSKLEQEYPFTEYFCYNMSHVCDSLRELESLELVDRATAKVVLVPKDSRGPRLISCEPLEIQWIQQGLGPVIERHINGHRLTGGYVNFTDQSINQDLALSGSRDGQWVTLDMKDASDRVSNVLVTSLFRHTPTLLAAMQACRSEATRLPDGRVVELKKFAPMGSRLCFPIEALCFYSLILSTLHIHAHKPMRSLLGSVYVYGDDIIMRKEDYLLALQHLPRFGLMFNPSKCCVSGFFRESCGVDAYKGVNVTPTRLSTTWCSTKKKPDVLSSFVALRNALQGLEYARSAAYIETALLSVYGIIPFTDKYRRSLNGAYVTEAGGPAFASDRMPARILNREIGIQTRVNSYLNVEVYSWTSNPKKVKGLGDSWNELLRRQSDAGYVSELGLDIYTGRCGGFYTLVRRNCLKRTWMVV